MEKLFKFPRSSRSQYVVDSCEDLRVVKRLGQGNMSTVFLAVHRGTQKPCALKVMNKEHLQDKYAYKMAATEKEILSSLDHPFLPSLLTHFESENYTFLAMKYCSGGDINILRHRQPTKTFSESTIRFYAAEVVVALEYLHEQGIVYRDLKPENILVQESGHIMLTDFDLSLRLMSHSNDHDAKRNEASQKGKNERRQCHSFAGTVEYIAPEVLWGKPHAFPVDCWSLGVFLYEMSHGRTPFRGSNRKDTFVNILCKEPSITTPCSPLNDLIRRLLAKEPSKRLGLEEVKSQPFFRGLKWDELEYVSRPPFVPPLSADPAFTPENQQSPEEYENDRPEMSINSDRYCSYGSETSWGADSEDMTKCTVFQEW